MARRRLFVAHNASTAIDPVLMRIRRARRRGEFRKAAIALREMVFREPSAARWVQLGHLLRQAGRYEQAVDAYKQGQWMHRRAGEDRKAAVVGQLLAAVFPPMAA